MKKIIIVIFVLCFVSANAQKFQTSVFVSPNFNKSFSKTDYFSQHPKKLNFGINFGFIGSFLKNNFSVELSISPVYNSTNYTSRYDSILPIILGYHKYYLYNIKTLNINTSIDFKLNSKNKKYYYKLGFGLSNIIVSKIDFFLITQLCEKDECIEYQKKLSDNINILKTDKFLNTFLNISIGRNFCIKNNVFFAEIHFKVNFYNQYFNLNEKTFIFRSIPIGLSIGYII